MNKEIYEKMNFKNSDVTYSFHRPIVEFDIHQASLSISDRYGLLDKDFVNKLKLLPKEDRVVQIGCIQRDDKEFSKKFLQYELDIRKQFIEENKIPLSDIITCHSDSLIFIYDGNIKDDAWINNITPCPYELKSEVYKTPDDFIHTRFIIPEGWKVGIFFPLYGFKFHPGGAIELREDVKNVNGSKHGNQCIYDKCGRLLTSIGSAGTADWYSPGLFGDKLHNKHDIIPYNLAKSLDRILDYYKVRPHIWLDKYGVKHINFDFY